MHKSASRWSRVCACFTALIIPSLASAQQGRDVIDTYTETIKGASITSALSANLFGDKVNLNDGTVQFKLTDVVAKTNHALPMSVGRSMDVSGGEFDAYGGITTPGVFGALWDLDVPYIRGKFAAGIGWLANTGYTNGGSVQRCSKAASSSYGARPPDVNGVGPFSSILYDPTDYWSGNAINIPGVGKEELLYLPTGRVRPGDGAAYYGSTVSNWRVSCISTVKNASGEGYRVTLPDGTKYDLDWMVSRSTTGILDSSQTQDGVSVPRNEITLYATRVADRFGNWVTYTYDPAAPSHLLSMASSDGASISLVYNPTGQVAQITTSGHTWQYSYSQGYLSSVTLPDGSKWTYSYNNLYNVTQTNARQLWDGCILHIGTMSSNATPGAGETAWISVGAPSGANAVFNFRRIIHGTKGTPSSCSVVRVSSWDYQGHPEISGPAMAYQLVSLYSKSVSGPGVQNQTWNYSYQPSWSMGPSCPGCTATSKVTDPDGTVTTYTFGNDFTTNAGQLAGTRVESFDGTVVQSSSFAYLTTASGQAFPDDAGQAVSSSNPFAFKNRPLVSKTVTQDGMTFSATNNSFDSFARSLSLTRASAGGASGNFARTDRASYFDDLATWTLGQIASSTEASTGLQESRVDFDSASDLPIRTYRFGVLQQSISYNADGTVATIKDGRDNVISLSNWKAGIPQQIAYPTAVTVSGIVNAAGELTSRTDQLGFATGYGYDSMGRLSLVTYPTGDTTAWNSTSRTFSAVFDAEYGLPAGHWREITQTGSGKTTTLYDAFWRPVLVLTEDVSEPASKSFVVKRYDARGREAFTGYPVSNVTSLDDPSLKGVQTIYDLLDRPTGLILDSELGPLGTAIEYLPGFKKQVTNARGYKTTTEYQVFDQPSFDSPVQVIEGVGLPEQQTTVITRDVFGKPLTITRSGN